MITLTHAAQVLSKRFGTQLSAPYVPGKTVLRDALCEDLAISQADAEVLCDSLEQTGAIRFERSAETGQGWHIAPAATDAE